MRTGSFLPSIQRQIAGVGRGLDAALHHPLRDRAAWSRLDQLTAAMRGAAALWIVYPKGQKRITENDVLSAGRKVGLKDVKVVGFSATHTALKFVIPLSKR